MPDNKQFQKIIIKKAENGWIITLIWETTQGNIFQEDRQDMIAKDIDEVNKIVAEHINKLKIG